MNQPGPRILGLGYQVPRNRRGNDDPIFDKLKARIPPDKNPFRGYKSRVVLGPGEDLMTIMVPAALNALQDAKLKPDDIDLVLGYASVSAFVNPNELSLLHQMLALPSRTYVVPLNNEFSNFNAGLLFADALIRAGRAKNILVAVGGNWTRFVSYETEQSISAADGAGAAVVGLSADPAKWRVADYETITDTSYFGSMCMQGERRPQARPDGGQDCLWSDPFFKISAKGMQGFAEFGGKAAPAAVARLLQRHGIAASAVSLIGHQASSVLFEMWKQVIQPAQIIQTIETFANMTIANIAVNLAWSAVNDPIKQNNLVLLALAPDMHAHVLLLQRDQPVP